MKQDDTRCRKSIRVKTSPPDKKTCKNYSLLIESSNDKFLDLIPFTETPPRPSQPFSLMNYFSSSFNSNNFFSNIDPNSFFYNFDPAVSSTTLTQQFLLQFWPRSFFCNLYPAVSSTISTQMFLLQLWPNGFFWNFDPAVSSTTLALTTFHHFDFTKKKSALQLAQ